ncbi:MAG: SDR family oxidoreductase [Bacteroidota bacterium]
MKSRFNGKVGIITGAGQGIGKEIASQLILEGGKLIINDIQESLAQQAAYDLNQKIPHSCIAMAGDAGQVDFTQQIVEAAMTNFGQLDLVVANAGITKYGDFLSVKEEEFLQVMDLNLKGAFFLTQAAAKKMIHQPAGGNILLMSSVLGQQGHPEHTVYAMTKAATIMMARSLITDLSPLGININVIAPGATLTERTEKDYPGYIESWQAVTPNRQIAYPADIAATALFLLSSAARHINGQAITIDGGWTAISPYPDGFTPKD